MEAAWNPEEGDCLSSRHFWISSRDLDPALDRSEPWSISCSSATYTLEVSPTFSFFKEKSFFRLSSVFWHTFWSLFKQFFKVISVKVQVLVLNIPVELLKLDKNQERKSKFFIYLIQERKKGFPQQKKKIFFKVLEGFLWISIFHFWFPICKKNLWNCVRPEVLMKTTLEFCCLTQKCEPRSKCRPDDLPLAWLTNKVSLTSKTT